MCGCRDVCTLYDTVDHMRCNYEKKKKERKKRMKSRASSSRGGIDGVKCTLCTAGHRRRHAFPRVDRRARHFARICQCDGSFPFFRAMCISSSPSVIPLLSRDETADNVEFGACIKLAVRSSVSHEGLTNHTDSTDRCRPQALIPRELDVRDLPP